MTRDDHGHEPAPVSRILVIDDEPMIARLAARALDPAGFTITGAVTGRHGMHIALHESCDLVVLDLGLPDMDGEELLRCLHRERPGQAVLICSASGDLKGPAWYRGIGACGYLAKPFTLAEFRQSIMASCPQPIAC